MSTFIYNTIAIFYYRVIVFRNYLYSLFVKKIDHKDIPIIINNRNRLTFLKMLIEALQRRGYNNIYILDNDSTYPPLIEFYNNINCKVILLRENRGFDALSQIPLYKEIKKNYFVYTDSDVVPVSICPEDFLDYFLNVLKKYPSIQKVGFSLKIDDLPDHNDKKNEIIKWESQYFENSFKENLFFAAIDTTFALHRPLATLSTKGRFKHLRTGWPYEAKHMPWYNDSSNLSKEEQYYNSTVEIGTHWSKGIEVSNKSFFDRFLKRK